MSMRDDKRSLNGDINVTPFLDVLLVLIITFMAAMTARKAMDAQLPVKCTGTCASSDDSIVLEVLDDGSYQLNRAPVKAPELLATLRDVYSERPDKVIQVAGHRGARYQDVLSAMDVARAAGVKVVSLPPSDSYDSRGLSSITPRR
jgi:biopolymer transport protein ExbD